MPTQDEFKAATDFVSKMQRPLLVSHARPDGDALGSIIALDSLLRSGGKQPVPLVFDSLPDRYESMAGMHRVRVHEPGEENGPLAGVDGIVVLDTCTYGQLSPIAEWLKGSSLPKLAVDHHASRDDLADVYLVDETASANCVIIYEWAQSSGWKFDQIAREALFTGIVMDTGWFGHSNTDSRTFLIAAQLSGSGVDPYAMRRKLFQHAKPGPIRLLGAALTRLRLTANDRIAVMSLPLDAFQQARALPGDTEDLIDQPMRIGSVVVAVLLVEQDDGITRVSFRSKPPASSGDVDVDVAAVAEAFGGGGHRRAAGARVEGDLPQVRDRIITYLAEALP